jgi:Na+/H+ antiporter NhaD/arsenite permease-like protein
MPPVSSTLPAVPIYMVAPFGLLLLLIAVLPLLVPEFWEKHHYKGLVAAGLAVPVAVWLVATGPARLGHTLIEYVSFICLLGSLFVVAGGLHVAGDLEGKPATNTAVLALGAVLASVIGTTGASMVLIRLLLRTNRQREHTSHLPFFFILLVSNCGGLLTALGDPPLFLGFLRGVPFLWTLRLWPCWLGCVGYLLALFYLVDARAHARETHEAIARDAREKLPLRVEGLVNLPLLLGIAGAVFLPTPWRELVMVALAAISYFVGPRAARTKNEFGFGPIVEVAVLFAGIFITMVPALELLEQRGGALGLRLPWHYFLATGGLSSVLDNAPTYLTFVAAAQGLTHELGLNPEILGIPQTYLAAISVGAVLMGANTYIGNGPNFMVKAIADSAGYRTYHFFRYAGLALLALSPVYTAIVLWFALTG